MRLRLRVLFVLLFVFVGLCWASDASAQVMRGRYFYGPLPWTSDARFFLGAPYPQFGPYDLLAGYPRGYLSATQPLGHEMVPLGPNGYAYRPIYPTPPQPVTRDWFAPRPATPSPAIPLVTPSPAVPPPQQAPVPAPHGGPREF